MQFENTITIPRPAREVFAYLADLRNIPKWNYAIESTEPMTPGPPRVGSAYRQTRKIPERSVEKVTITAFEPDRHLVISGTLGPFDAVLGYDLVETEGGTRLTNSAELQARGAARLLAPLAVGRVRSAVAANLQALKQLLESGA